MTDSGIAVFYSLPSALASGLENTKDFHLRPRATTKRGRSSLTISGWISAS